MSRALHCTGFSRLVPSRYPGVCSRLGLSLVEVVLGLVIAGLVLIPLLQAVLALHRASVPRSVSIGGRDFPTCPSLVAARLAAEAHGLLSAEIAQASGIGVLPRCTLIDGDGAPAFLAGARWSSLPSGSDMAEALLGSSLLISGPDDWVLIALRSEGGGGYAFGCLASVRRVAEDGWAGWAVDVITRDGARRAYACAAPAGAGPSFASCYSPSGIPEGGIGAEPVVLRFPDPSVPAWGGTGAKPLSRYHYVLDAIPW